MENKPLPSILLINMYMPSHPEDLHLISIIKTHLIHTIDQYPEHITILGRDFNRDIAMIGRQDQDTHHPPSPKDILWKRFTTYLKLQ